MKPIIQQAIAYFVMFLIIITPEAYALSISGVTITDIKTNSATINWQTDNESNSIASYGKSQTNMINKTDDTKTKNHTITITGLDEDTKYYASVTSENITDNNGNSYYSFRTHQTEATPTNTENGTIAEENITYIFRGVPQITLTPISTMTKNANMTIKGTSQPNVTIRFFINDHKIPEQILETGQFSIQTGANGSFTGTIKLLEGYYNETIGLNNIKIEGTLVTTNYFRNYAYLQTVFDTTPPTLNLNLMPTATNNNTLAIKGTTSEDATIQIFVMHMRFNY